MPGRTGPEVAAQEAFEEAGVRGRIAGAGKPFGKYRYFKSLTPGCAVCCHVVVYRLKVMRELADWPERDQRERRWFDLAAAAALVQEPALAEMLKRLAKAGRASMPVRRQPHAT